MELLQWDTTDAELKVFSAENPELKCVLHFIAWNRSEYSHICFPYIQNFFHVLISCTICEQVLFVRFYNNPAGVCWHRMSSSRATVRMLHQWSSSARKTGESASASTIAGSMRRQLVMPILFRGSKSLLIRWSGPSSFRLWTWPAATIKLPCIPMTSTRRPT